MNNSIVNETHEALNHIDNFMDKIDNPFLGAPVIAQLLQHEASHLTFRTVQETYIETPSSTIRISHLPDGIILLHVSPEHDPTKWYAESIGPDQAATLKQYTGLIRQNTQQATAQGGRPA